MKKNRTIFILFILLLISINNLSSTKIRKDYVLKSICQSNMILIGNVIGYKYETVHSDEYVIEIDTIIRNNISYQSKEIIIHSTQISGSHGIIYKIYGHKLIFVDNSNKFNQYILSHSFDLDVYNIKSTQIKNKKSLEPGTLTRIQNTFYGIYYDEREFKRLEIEIPNELLIDVNDFRNKGKKMKIIPVSYLLKYCNAL